MKEQTIHLQPAAHVRVYGTGEPVLLLHGWGANSELFHPISSQLEQHFQLIVPDFPGFGNTPAPPTAWSVYEYAQWVRDLLQELQIKQAHIVGHSFGGRIGIILASETPQLVHKLVLTASAGIRPARTWRYHLRVRSYKLLRWLSNQTWLGPLRQKAAQAVAQRGSADYQQAAGTVRASLIRVVNQDLRHLLPLIQAETLLIWGDQDQDTPLSDAQLMERLIPDAGLVVLNGAGHYAYLERAPQWCTIVRTFFQSPPVNRLTETRNV